MLEQDVKKPKKEPWRMPQDFRLVDFHKPLLQQAPVIFFVLVVSIVIIMTIGVMGYEGH